MEFTFQQIGRITTCYPEKFGTPRQGALTPESWGVIELEPWIQPELALRGLEDFSHLWILYVFHLNQNKRVKPVVHPPRLGGETMGVFATRSPHHPNPIGLTCVRLESIRGSHLRVSGVDLVSGTPILDIKPYLPFADNVPDAKGGWAEQTAASSLEVLWSPAALKDIQSVPHGARETFQRLVEATLRLDPRPVSYRENQHGEAPYGDLFWLSLEDWNLSFQVQAGAVEILKVEPLPKTRK